MAELSTDVAFTEFGVSTQNSVNCVLPPVLLVLHLPTPIFPARTCGNRSHKDPAGSVIAGTHPLTSAYGLFKVV